jgi:hypothetical protein
MFRGTWGIVLQYLRDAAPVRKRFGRGIPCGRKTRVAGGRECGDIGIAEVVKTLIERIVVQIAIGAVRPNITVIGVRGDSQVIFYRMGDVEGQGWRVVPGDVWNRVDRGVVHVEEAKVRRPVPSHPVVRVCAA